MSSLVIRLKPTGNWNGVTTSIHMRILLEYISDSFNFLQFEWIFFCQNLPLLRFRLVSAFKYLLTFLKIVLGAGELRPGNLA